ncbi:sentrin-specific protease 6-like [Ornithodoros turicata]|uniref:sentrin-specific protease 6-like n=1 Tax=Ornithodoros turicata TaxID=34597 RepID=UPI0031398AD0
MEGVGSPQQSRTVNWQSPSSAKYAPSARPGIHSTNVPSSPDTGPEAVNSPYCGEKYISCLACGQASRNLKSCDFCGRTFEAGAKVKRKYVPQHPKRKLDLGSSSTAVGSNTSPLKLSPSPPEYKLSRQTFYGRGTATAGGALHISAGNNGQGVQLIVQPASLSLSVLASAPPPPKKLGRRIRKEPECLTISSDEEADIECQSEAKEEKLGFTARSTPVNNVHGKENHVVGQELVAVPNNKPLLQPAAAAHRKSSDVVKPRKSMQNVIVPGSAALQRLRFSCRSIRVGSYKVTGGKYWVETTPEGFQFSIKPVVPCDDEVTIHLSNTDITSVMGHLARTMMVLYVTTTSECGSNIREKLKMTRRNSYIYDPESKDDREKRITFLPDPALSEDEKYFLRTVFPGPLFHEIDQVVANEILIKSAPASKQMEENGVSLMTPMPHQKLVPSSVPYAHVIIQNVPPNATILTRSITHQALHETPTEPNVKLLVYPPPPQTGGITVHSADFMCLGEAQFLNDVIIDFYLKYLLREKVSEDVRERTHIFSSFFYPRLTQRLHGKGTAGTARLTPAARRHRNVRTWTRHVDIFEKDYIIVPINQNAHWFLAIVCFPGLVARTSPPQAMIQHTSTDDVPTSAEQSPTSLGPPSTPDGKQDCGQDDGEGPLDSEPDEAAMDTDDSENPIPKSVDCAESAYILVLDSLRSDNGSKCRIMSTLREYLTEEWTAKKQSQLTFRPANMKGYIPMTPQQGNFSDCGVYLLQYVESFLENPPRDGRPVKLELSNWFPENRVLQKRSAIQDLILQLHLQQQPDSDFPLRWQQQEEVRIKAEMESEAAASEVLSTPLVIPETPPKSVGPNRLLVLYTPSPTLS